MAKYSKKASEKVEEEMKEMKAGKLKIGRSNNKVTNPKQAIAIGLSEARKSGAKVPDKPATKKVAAKKAVPRKAVSKNVATKKIVAKKASSKKRVAKKSS